MRAFGAIGARIYRLFNRNPRSNRIVVDLLELTPADRVLEVGCGPGAAVELAAERIGAERVAAVDPSETFVTMVQDRVPGVDVRVSGAEDLPFNAGAFTAIWSIASMHHWEDRSAGLASVTTVLAPGGRLLLAERLIGSPGHGITVEQAAEVVAELERLGCSDVRTEQYPNGRKTMLVVRARRDGNGHP